MFLLLSTDIQPRLATPQLIQKGATWIQIGWEPVYCDGGYILNYYHVQYGLGTYYSIYTTHGATKALNYTIRGLTASTEYKIRVGRESTGASTISYSPSVTIITLSAGKEISLEENKQYGHVYVIY